MPHYVRSHLDYYAMLEISSAADTAEVNAAFRRLAWRYHPDRNHAPGATLQFQDINEAHQVLSDPARRAEYDAKWHPRIGQPTGVPRRSRPVRSRRRWRMHRSTRTVVLAMAAVLFVSSAWALIFTAMTEARSSGGSFSFDSAVSPMSAASSNCSFSMEMFPVSYTDARGRLTTGWETEVHDCYGGAIRFAALPATGVQHLGRFANDPQLR